MLLRTRSWGTIMIIWLCTRGLRPLPASEMLPRNEVLGGYIFVCNNDTMQEDLKRHLFGLPPRYRDSVRAITPGLPLFLYNYTTHRLHGIFEGIRYDVIGRLKSYKHDWSSGFRSGLRVFRKEKIN